MENEHFAALAPHRFLDLGSLNIPDKWHSARFWKSQIITISLHPTVQYGTLTWSELCLILPFLPQSKASNAAYTIHIDISTSWYSWLKIIINKVLIELQTNKILQTDNGRSYSIKSGSNFSSNRSLYICFNGCALRTKI